MRYERILGLNPEGGSRTRWRSWVSSETFYKGEETSKKRGQCLSRITNLKIQLGGINQCGDTHCIVESLRSLCVNWIPRDSKSGKRIKRRFGQSKK